jgi:HD-like signal output (HDOD) protein
MPDYLDDLENLLLWEKEAFGIDHHQVGGFVPSQWAFPDKILLCQEAGLKKTSEDPLPPPKYSRPWSMKSGTP